MTEKVDIKKNRGADNTSITSNKNIKGFSR